MCLCFFISLHQQQQRSRVSPRTSIDQTIYPYQQGPPRNVRIRPGYDRNTPSLHLRSSNVYEEPPPSYEAAVTEFSPKYQATSSSLPLVTTNIELTNERL
ncbi:unnamed protein product [Rotaria sp. Silwood1]|nr:unnamed protein product [Rotaria sp. Silwood1]